MVSNAGNRVDVHDRPTAHAGRPSPFQALVPAVLAFLTGAWLVLAPFVLGYRSAGDGFNGHANDVIVGLVVIMVASMRMISPPSTAPWSCLNIVAGAWLLVAPWVLDYNKGVDAVQATVNDMAAGAWLLGLALVSLWLTRRGRTARK